jgi:DNA-binding transcriptional MerR regulator
MSAAAILKLQASGFSSEKVSALAELLDTQVATKADIEAAEHRLEIKVAAVKAEVEAAEHRLEVRIAGLKGDVEAAEHRLDLKISELKAQLQSDIAETKSEMRVMRWMIGITLAFQLAIFAKLFLH